MQETRTNNMKTELNSRNKNSQRKYRIYQQIDTRVIKKGEWEKHWKDMALRCTARSTTVAAVWCDYCLWLCQTSHPEALHPPICSKVGPTLRKTLMTCSVFSGPLPSPILFHDFSLLTVYVVNCWASQSGESQPPYIMTIDIDPSPFLLLLSMIK